MMAARQTTTLAAKTVFMETSLQEMLVRLRGRLLHARRHRHDDVEIGGLRFCPRQISHGDTAALLDAPPHAERGGPVQRGASVGLGLVRGLRYAIALPHLDAFA